MPSGAKPKYDWSKLNTNLSHSDNMVLIGCPTTTLIHHCNKYHIILPEGHSREYRLARAKAFAERLNNDNR